ncbi:MAG: hypothetical protein WA773_13190, partial [Bradyrhizobium sp.]
MTSPLNCPIPVSKHHASMRAGPTALLSHRVSGAGSDITSKTEIKKREIRHDRNAIPLVASQKSLRPMRQIDC